MPKGLRTPRVPIGNNLSPQCDKKVRKKPRTRWRSAAAATQRAYARSVQDLPVGITARRSAAAMQRRV